MPMLNIAAGENPLESQLLIGKRQRYLRERETSTSSWYLVASYNGRSNIFTT